MSAFQIDPAVIILQTAPDCYRVAYLVNRGDLWESPGKLNTSVVRVHFARPGHSTREGALSEATDLKLMHTAYGPPAIMDVNACGEQSQIVLVVQ